MDLADFVFQRFMPDDVVGGEVCVTRHGGVRNGGKMREGVVREHARTGITGRSEEEALEGVVVVINKE